MGLSSKVVQLTLTGLITSIWQDDQRQCFEHHQTGAAMVTMLDRQALPSQSSQVMSTSRPAPVWPKISSALRATSSFDSTLMDCTRLVNLASEASTRVASPRLTFTQSSN